MRVCFDCGNNKFEIYNEQKGIVVCSECGQFHKLEISKELEKCYSEITDKEAIIAEVYSNSFLEGVENLLDESEEINECKYPDFRNKIEKIKANRR